VKNWILKNRQWSNNSQPFVKVHFEDEPENPLPENTTMKHFQP